MVRSFMAVAQEVQTSPKKASLRLTLIEQVKVKGAASLDDAGLLAMSLRPSDPQGTGLVLANRLLDQLGSVQALLSSGLHELTAAGLTVPESMRLHCLLELCRRTAVCRAGVKFTDPQDIYNYVSPRLATLDQEIFMVLTLDTRRRLIREYELFKGTVNEAITSPREILRMALRDNAVALVLIHNHPSGDPAPSVADIELTRRLDTAAKVMGMTLLDHLIVGRGTYASFVDRGLLQVASPSGRAR